LHDAQPDSKAAEIWFPSKIGRIATAHTAADDKMTCGHITSELQGSATFVLKGYL